MKLFLSWSGERSRAVAEALKGWIPNVIQAVEPWMSEDMPKGIRWSPEIAEQLEQSKIGIVCLTADNLSSEWILFEAGALSKTKDAQVITLLLDIKKADVRQPLGQFHHTSATDQEDMRKLVHTINDRVLAVKEKALADERLNKLFQTFWPELEPTLRELASRPPAAARPKRQDREILEEILQTVRSQESRLETLLHQATLRSDLLAQYSGLGTTDPSSIAAIFGTSPSAWRSFLTFPVAPMTVHGKTEEPPGDDTTSSSTPLKERTK